MPRQRWPGPANGLQRRLWAHLTALGVPQFRPRFDDEAAVQPSLGLDIPFKRVILNGSRAN